MRQEEKRKNLYFCDIRYVENLIKKMSKGIILHYSCFILAAIPLLGLFLAISTDFDDLLRLCIAPVTYICNYGRSSLGDGGLGIFIEMFITIPLEIILCIYCLFYCLVVIIEKTIIKIKRFIKK